MGLKVRVWVDHLTEGDRHERHSTNNRGAAWAFLNGTLAVEFRPLDEDGKRYECIAGVLKRLRYRRLRRADKGVVNLIGDWLGLSSPTVSQASKLVLRWGVPLALAAITLYSYHQWWSRRGRTERIADPLPTTQPNAESKEDEFVPMKEAATRVYEKARKVGSLWAYAAERLGARGMNQRSSENEILNYMATFIAGKIQLYGVRPPSRILEPIADADKRNGVFENNATEFRFLLGKSPTYTSLRVTRHELESLIQHLAEGTKANDQI